MSSADAGEDNDVVAAIALALGSVAGYVAIYNIISLVHSCTLASKYRKEGIVIVGRVVIGADLFDEYVGLWFQQNDLGKSSNSDVTSWNRTLTVDYTVVDRGEIQTFRKRFPKLAFKTVRNSLRQGEVELYMLSSEGAMSAYPRLEFHLSVKERCKRQIFRLGMTALLVCCIQVAATSGSSGFVSIGLPIVLAIDFVLATMKYMNYRNHLLSGGKALKSDFRSTFKREETSRDVEWPSAQPEASGKGWTFGDYKPVATSDPDPKSDRSVPTSRSSMPSVTTPDVEAPPPSRRISDSLFLGTSSGPFGAEVSAPPLAETDVAINFDPPKTEKKKKKKRPSADSRSTHSRSSMGSESSEERRVPGRTRSMPWDRDAAARGLRSSSSSHNSPVRVSRSSVSSSSKSPVRSRSLVRTRASFGGIGSNPMRHRSSESLKNSASRKSRSSLSSTKNAEFPDSHGSNRRAHSPKRTSSKSGSSSSRHSRSPMRTKSDSSTKSKDRKVRHSTIL